MQSEIERRSWMLSGWWFGGTWSQSRSWWATVQKFGCKEWGKLRKTQNSPPIDRYSKSLPPPREYIYIVFSYYGMHL